MSEETCEFCVIPTDATTRCKKPATHTIFAEIDGPFRCCAEHFKMMASAPKIDITDDAAMATLADDMELNAFLTHGRQGAALTRDFIEKYRRRAKEKEVNG